LSRKLYIILGNGFTIDFLSHARLSSDVDVRNLFRYGACVPWPVDGEPGFLSFKHCPNLWNLGARPNMDDDAATALIEDIITCVNVFVSAPRTTTVGQEGRPNDIYSYAYKELAIYLKHLFIYYDTKVDALPDCNSWGWWEFFRHIAKSDYYSEITIVTYNYDVWLERLLTHCGIPFTVSLMQRKRASAKISILKPHGSISFAHKTIRDRNAFTISLNHELLDGRPRDFVVKYDKMDENYLVNALIPPAGEAGRFNHSLASAIRNRAKEQATALGAGDDIIISGLSYWHVDRAELDELLVSCSPTVDVKMINPSPSPSLNAVLASIFNNYIAYNAADVLKEFKR